MSFEYSNFENDRTPLILYINTKFGLNESTGHLHQYIEGINLHYIPLQYRQKFMKDWLELNKERMFVKNNFYVFWAKLVKRFPYLEPAFRRYFYYPTSYIKRAKKITNAEITKILEYDLSEYKKESDLTFIKKYKEFNRNVNSKRSRRK